MKIVTKLFLVGAGLLMVVLLATCSDPTPSGPVIDPNEVYVPVNRSIHLEVNQPVDADSTDDYLIVRRQYALSYNKNKNEANWVSWELNKSWYGAAERYSGTFITDTSLPVGFTRIKHSDYTNSGFDRGHLVRSEERTIDDADNKSTFILTNILPQRPDLNQGVWYDMEQWCETMCKDSTKELFVIAGGIYTSNSTINKLVAIPDSCFKIVVVLESGQRLSSITKTTRIEAVIMPNIQGIRADNWQKYKRTIDEIEAATGYDFLNYVRKDIQAVIESKPSIF